MATYDDDLPCNQEALFKNMDVDSDYDDVLDLTKSDDNTGTHELNIAYAAIGNIQKLYNERLEIAKAREWLALANGTKKTPPFCYINIRCTPSLGDNTLEEKFKTTVNNAIEEATRLFYQKTISEMDSYIQEKTDKITDIRQKAKAEIGTKTKGSAQAKKILYEKLGSAKSEIDTKLQAHQEEVRTNLFKIAPTHSRPPPYEPRGSGISQRGSRNFRGRGGRRGHSYRYY